MLTCTENRWPQQLLACHPLVAPGEVSVIDAHYPGPRSATPARAVRAKTTAEKAFLALGPAAEAFLTGAAAAGSTRLGAELGELLALGHAHGQAALDEALTRATAFGRWRAEDVRSTLAHGHAPVPRPGRGRPGRRPARRPDPLPGRLRHRSERGRVMSATAPALDADLEAGLKRLTPIEYERLHTPVTA